MTDYDTQAFTTASAWRSWLEENHHQAAGIWIRLYKKASGIASVTYAEALDHALCYGWIDGQRKSYDALSYVQKFTPRRKASLWSKRNIEYVQRLTAANLMTPAGVAEVERAQIDGRWAAAYDKPSDMVMPVDFLKELSKYPKAEATFTALTKSNTYAIAWALQTARTDITRQRRQAKIIAALEAGTFS